MVLLGPVLGQSMVAWSPWMEVTRPRRRMLVGKFGPALGGRPPGVKVARWEGRMRGVASLAIVVLMVMVEADVEVEC